MMQDWTANSKSTFATLGASNHTGNEREARDFYATPEIATRKLLEQEEFSKGVWECACGAGHISKVLDECGYKVFSSDIVNRMRHVDHKIGNAVIDFLNDAPPARGGYDIVTNPPYRYAQEFVERALRLLSDGHKCAFLLRLQFLEGIKRRKMFEANPPKTVYVFSKRVQCCINGEFEKYKGAGSAIAYAWFVWQKGYEGDTVIKWI